MPNSNPACQPPSQVDCGGFSLPLVIYAQFEDAAAPNGACADGAVVPLYLQIDPHGLPITKRWTTRGHYENQPDPPFGNCEGEHSGTPTQVFIEFECSGQLSVDIYNTGENPSAPSCGNGGGGPSSTSLDPFEYVYNSIVGPSADCLCCPWPGFDGSFNVTIKATL